MKMELPPESFRALPMQVIEVPGGVVLKRGMTEMKVSGAGAVGVVRMLIAAASGEPVTLEALASQFPETERAAAMDLARHLVRRRLLVAPDAEEDAPWDGAGGATREPAAEGAEDVFYWHFRQRTGEVARRLDEQRIAVVGVNLVARHILESLASMGVRALASKDDPMFRNPRLFDSRGQLRSEMWPDTAPPEPVAADLHDLDPSSFDCLVVASDHGGLALVSSWNEYCALHRRPLLPVVLQDLIGYVGPLVVPGETACYECFRQRLATSLPEPRLRQTIENAVADAVVGFVPPMVALLGSVATMELVKFYGLGPPYWQVGTLIEVNAMIPDVTARKVLKLPRCPVCSPVAERPSVLVRSADTRAVAPSGGRG
jgi:bacteriocin biosynthesis cyclodehydratase domain-containing protein